MRFQYPLTFLVCVFAVLSTPGCLPKKVSLPTDENTTGPEAASTLAKLGLVSPAFANGSPRIFEYNAPAQPRALSTRDFTPWQMTAMDLGGGHWYLTLQGALTLADGKFQNYSGSFISDGEGRVPWLVATAPESDPLKRPVSLKREGSAVWVRLGDEKDMFELRSR